MIFIGITTYGSIGNIIDQVENIYLKENEYWIHYNKREKNKDFKKLKKYFNKYNNVTVFSKYKVYWGHYSILKSCIYMQKKFLKSDKEIFLHLDAKTCNVISPEKLNEYLIKKNNNGYNFMQSSQENITSMYVKECNKNFFVPLKKEENWCFLRNWYFRSSYINNKHSSIYMFLFIYFKSIKNPRIFFQLSKQICQYIFLKNFFWDWLKWINLFFYNSELILLFNKKKYFIPKKLEKMEFVFSTKGGGNLIINKTDLSLILNSGFFKKLLKFSKKKYAPEEWFFESLFFTLFAEKKNNSINVFFYKIGEINNKTDVINLKNEKICFLRRVIGSEEIKKIINIFN